MNSLLLVFNSILILCNVINGQFTPSIAFHENLPPMYKTDKGWVVNDTVTNKIVDHLAIVQFCKDTYPNDTIINAVPRFRKEVITNWCKVKEKCTVNNTYEIHPIECINANYSYRPIYIPSYCKLNLDDGKGCVSFHSLKEKAKTSCELNDQTLSDLQVIFPCKDKFMLFAEVEYTCCSSKDEHTQYSSKLRSKLNAIHKRYISVLDIYKENKSLHLEHLLFSKGKHALEQSYHQSLEALNNEAVEDLRVIIKKKHDLPSESYKKAEEKLYETYKHNFESITHKLKVNLFHLDNIHIRRIVKRSDNICPMKNNTDLDLGQCLKELDNISKKITAHFRKMMHLQGLDRRQYLTFIESRLKHIYSKYLPLANGNQDRSDKFHKQLQKHCLKLKSSSIPSHRINIRAKFDRCKNKATLYLHNQEHYFSLAPMVGIIAAIILAVIAIVVTVLYKYGGNLFRKGTHNYVMRVVGDPDLSSQSINRPEVKLNLYENPIFNSKPSSRSIEKQGLIENMEN